MMKLNNKGFAITTLIYGLAIMGIMIVAILMATMSKTRTNNVSLAKAIEADLNRYSKTETSFKPLGDYMEPQEYMIPTDGWYRIELWGSQGGGSDGGKGAYTTGIIELEEGDLLYFYVGKHKNNVAGGYSTEVRLVNGEYEGYSSYISRIMVAAGGGIKSTAAGGTLYGYNYKMLSYGGFIQSQGLEKDFSLLPTSEDNNTNGSLVGYTKDYSIDSNDSITLTAGSIGSWAKGPFKNLETTGGGYGYYSSENPETGGTSYIAGYTGCRGTTKGRITNDSKFVYYEYYTDIGTFSEDSLGTYYFQDGRMLPGVKTGDGYAKIERILEKTDDNMVLTRKNTKLDNVRYIKACSDEEDDEKEIVVGLEGTTSISLPKTIDGKCTTVDIGADYSEGLLDIDEIVVFHKNSGVDYKKDVISVAKEENGPWITVKGYKEDETQEDSPETELSETQTVTGYRVTAYQYDAMKPLPSGKYIIQPVLSENKVLSAAKTSQASGNPITIEPYVGEKRQKWDVQLITNEAEDPANYEYKIIELSRYKALAITQDENVLYNTVSAQDKFNENARNEPQIWKIIPAGNGTYMIETVVPQINSQANTGYLTPQTNNTGSGTDTFNQIIIGKKNRETARFKFIQLDYSSTLK